MLTIVPYINFMLVNQNQIVLVYYKFRGQLQPIRNLLCFLDLPFLEVHPQFMEKESAQWSISLKEKLKAAKIDKSKLPLLIFENYTVYQPYPILHFVCHRFGRGDLLGTNPQQKARIQEILQIYFIKQPQSMIQLFRLSDIAQQKNKQQMQIILTKSFESLMNRSGYIRQICEHLDNQLNPKYILLNQITIADFLFLETCNYMLGMYDQCDKYEIQYRMPTQQKEYFNFNEQGERIGKKINTYYLKIMRDFKLRMEKHNFYQKYSHYLESFSIISVFMTPQRTAGLRKIWKLKEFFIK